MYITKEVPTTFFVITHAAALNVKASRDLQHYFIMYLQEGTWQLYSVGFPIPQRKYPILPL